MIDIPLWSFLLSVFKTAISWFSGTKKAIDEHQKDKISNEEKELLIEAASRKGMFYKLSLPWNCIRVTSADGKDNAVDFYKEKDLAYTAKYRDALQSLINRGYVEYNSDVLYTLTDSSWNKARE